MKPKASSKTLWLNIATIALLVISAATVGLGDLGIDPLTQARILWFSNLLNAGLNGIVRLYTYTPLAGTPGQVKALVAEAEGKMRGGTEIGSLSEDTA